ncbi:PorT family protein [Fulvivirga sp. M361]|uniref:type IX secretion/gliding motility protein PorT/SprT n=1 Tax=Fulvivirga sp. M361 TaxID=2594266 RepID=UPI00117B99D5|nr:porin family protein [Fulvivirga sp. M361]TRX57767.1 PorT family protein [Fulvivirga sp. M361]
MQATNIWDKLHLHRGKVVIVLFLLFSLITRTAFSQRNVDVNNPNYDNRFLSYGFLIGLHTSTFQLKYSDAFLSRDLDNIYSIDTRWGPGFSLGFIVNMKLADFLDIRVLPKIAFYEHEVIYTFLDQPEQLTQAVETSVVELPLVLKYKSERRGNTRMYLIGGVKPGFEASGKNDLQGQSEDNLPINEFNLSVELGFGLDVYYPLFKFSPELRFSKGVSNMLGDKINPLSAGIDRLNTNTVTLYLLFQ